MENNGEHSLEGIEILIVDDEPELIEVLGMRLQSLGAKISLAYNGEEAIALLKDGKYRPDVILLDVFMPQMDGWEFCRAASEMGLVEHIPIVMCTAGKSQDIEVKARESGVCLVINKPYDESSLINKLKRVVNK